MPTTPRHRADRHRRDRRRVLGLLALTALAGCTGGGTGSIVYSTPGYEAGVRNLAATPLAADPVFADGWDTQLMAVVGTASTGLTATLLVPVAT